MRNYELVANDGQREEHIFSCCAEAPEEAYRQYLSLSKQFGKDEIEERLKRVTAGRMFHQHTIDVYLIRQSGERICLERYSPIIR